MRTAKALQKIKHINHVKSAIKYHEAARAKKEAIFRERFEGKQALLLKQKYDAKWIRGDIKRARHNYREDWALGPLRPNRAVGVNAELYGAIEKDQLRFPDIPIHTQRIKNKLREKAGLDPEWPIIVDDKRLFPIVKNDRVVVIRGTQMNKIGIVASINEESHMVELKDVNQVYVDSSIFATTDQEQEKPKREFNFPFNVNDLRLVAPMTVTEMRDGRPVNVQQDVIIDNVYLEKYTKGINPHSSDRNPRNSIPSEHRLNPETNEPIYHRYISGTRTLVDWPLDMSVTESLAEGEAKSNEGEDTTSFGTSVRGGFSKALNPTSWFRSSRNSKPATLESGLFSKSKPKEEVPVETEITENEAPEEHRPDYTPLYTPMFIEREPFLSPSAVEQHQTLQSTDETPASIQKSQQLKPVRTKPKITKTPQELVWEYQERQKRKTRFMHHNQRPKLDDSLLEAIGMHMEKNGVKVVSRKTEVSEVD